MLAEISPARDTWRPRWARDDAPYPGAPSKGGSPMRRLFTLCVATILAVGVLASAVIAKDRPFATNRLIAMKLAPSALDPGAAGITGLGGGQFSKVQIEAFTCSTAGNPAARSTSAATRPSYKQDFSPGQRDRDRRRSGRSRPPARGIQRLLLSVQQLDRRPAGYVPTGFFTSFDGGATWIDGQIPMRSGNGAGDPSPRSTKSTTRR